MKLNMNGWMRGLQHSYLLFEDEILEENSEFPMERRYNDYYRLALSGTEMPQSTNANRYKHNYAYGNIAYDKGAVFLSQLDIL